MTVLPAAFLPKRVIKYSCEIATSSLWKQLKEKNLGAHGPVSATYGTLKGWDWYRFDLQIIADNGSVLIWVLAGACIFKCTSRFFCVVCYVMLDRI